MMTEKVQLNVIIKLASLGIRINCRLTRERLETKNNNNNNNLMFLGNSSSAGDMIGGRS